MRGAPRHLSMGVTEVHSDPTYFREVGLRRQVQVPRGERDGVNRARLAWARGEGVGYHVAEILHYLSPYFLPDY